MLDILSEMGFPKHLFALPEAPYSDLLANMRWNGRHSGAFTIERLVRKGYMLSPHLFNLYTDSVTRQSGIAIKIGENWVII